MHQGDLEKEKGVYHINAVDEVTQYQCVVTVAHISELYLLPALGQLLDCFPFIIKGFHSDNGSEFINHQVAKMLEKMRIDMTKSRLRRSNDNALVESKNGSSVRKFLGYSHIASRFAEQVDAFNKKHFVPYLNFHKPCYFAEEKVLENGKRKKIYRYENMMTPYEKFKSLPHAERHLKDGVTFCELDRVALSMTAMQAANELQQARKSLFQHIAKQTASA